MSTTPTPSRSATPPTMPVQPDHFFGPEGTQLPPSPNSLARAWLDPADDPLAHRGIPVFKPTMDEFANFEQYMSKVECWGLRSGIIKVIPPKEWADALPPIKDQLLNVKIRSPIEQHMLGRGGLFRQENVEKRKVMSVREWAELCDKEEFRAPGIDDLDIHARGTRADLRPFRGRRTRTDSRKVESVEPDEPNTPLTKEEHPEDFSRMLLHPASISPPQSVENPLTPNTNTPIGPASDCSGQCQDVDMEEDPVTVPTAQGDPCDSQEKPKSKGKRVAQTRAAREASLAERAVKDKAFIDVFDPRKDWLPPNTKTEDYTPEFCQKLERQYWRNCGLGKPAWYGADMQGSLYTDETKIWNVAHLPSLLSRLLPASSKGLPGVNTPYLYFGMWRATFAWHVEDMDLFSINYIHFGAPKFWYAVPQGRAAALESTMKGYFPQDTSQCPQFLRHKSFLASPTLLAQSSCRPNFLVQREREFVITFPRGYHAGFNLGLNCAESVNFALESWLELGRKAQVCRCVTDSVRIDVDQLLRDREAERLCPPSPPEPRKRKAESGEGNAKGKRPKSSKSISSSSGQTPGSSGSANTSRVTVTLKLPPKPLEPDGFPCCLCVSKSRDGLLRVQHPPIGRKDLPESLATVFNVEAWMAHEECAKVVPETWVDEVDLGGLESNASMGRERRVFGVDAIVKDRWNLKCVACTKGRSKAHGAPIQCTKGKCTKSFHVSCAREGASGIAYSVVRELEKEVLLVGYHSPLGELLETSDTNQPGPTPVDPQVLKIIKKNEVQVLCSQHNPAVAAAKKANKQDKIRNELISLEPMSRIKIRVTSGVFEVSLVRIIEETKSIEVLWDRGIKREFKWGSVLFGSSDDQAVVQKPAEPAPLQPTLPPVPNTQAVSTYSGSADSPSTVLPTITPTLHLPTHTATANTSGTGAWPYSMYQTTQTQAYPSLPYSYPGYYIAPQGHRPPANGSNTAHGTYRFQLQWQRPYTGPKTNADSTAPPTSALPPVSSSQDGDAAAVQTTYIAS
ncbi:JmjC domain, hydroxylase-domain-containing protein [Pisolithus thermaeus]|nr:JmjC domain, hydroxylase-domain-containing protein [Pisolithus thermaeus]